MLVNTINSSYLHDMNLSEKGWFKEFVQIKSQQIEKTDLDPERKLYKKLQPSGVLYGYPSVLKDIESHSAFEMDRTTKMKLVLLHVIPNQS